MIAGVALACFIAQLAVVSILVPPWQNPDEPQHVHTVRLVLEYGPDFSLEDHFGDPTEQAIVESMARDGWWRQYGIATPNPLPKTFAEGPAQVTGGYLGAPGGGSRVYYRAAAALFRAAGIDDPIGQLYALRALSALWGTLTVACIWASMRTMFGKRAALAIAAAAALHPQFAIAATTASPDAFVNLAGAVVWWQSALVVTSPARWRTIAVLIVAGVVALLTRRLGAVLLPIAAGVVVFAGVRALGAVPFRRVVWTAAGTVVALAVTGTVLSAVPDLTRAIAWLRFDLDRAATVVADDPVGLANFFGTFYRSWWLTAGWMRYAAPHWWYTVTAIITLVVVIGLFPTVIKPGAVSHSRQLRLVYLSLGMLAIQSVAVVAYQFGVLQAGAQGRYLLPVFSAALCLIWIGWNATVGRGGRETLATVSLVAVFGVLNVTAWAFVLLPRYG